MESTQGVGAFAHQMKYAIRHHHQLPMFEWRGIWKLDHPMSRNAPIDSNIIQTRVPTRHNCLLQITSEACFSLYNLLMLYCSSVFWGTVIIQMERENFSSKVYNTVLWIFGGPTLVDLFGRLQIVLIPIFSINRWT